MGAWGVGPFENDSAADYVGDLAEYDEDVTGRLSRVPPTEEYLEGPDGDELYAASALVAGLCGYAADDVAEALADSGPRGPADSGTRAMALQAIERLQGENNEWRELWSEAGEFGEIRERLTAMAAAIRAAD